MDQHIGCIKTVVRIIGSCLCRHPELTGFPSQNSCSDLSYEITIDLEALDCIGNVTEIEGYHQVDDMIQAWRIIQALRPGSIHNMEVDISYILPANNGARVMFPDFLPYLGDVDEINSLFSHVNSSHSSLAWQSEDLKTISGRIKDILIEKTKQNGDIAIIHLAEREDYGLVIFADLYESHKSMILGKDHLEYAGMPQECYLSGNCSETMIFVSGITVPTETIQVNGEGYER